MMKTIEPTDEDGLPTWARPLFAGEIVVTAETEVEQLANTIEERLDALFSLFNCSPDEAGWRKLALNLALGFSIDGTRVMDITTPIDRDPKEGGRPAEFGPILWMTRANRIIEDAAKKGSHIRKADAARMVSKEFEGAPKPKRIQNLFSEFKDRPLSNRLEWDRRIQQALNIAANRISSPSR
jgi:hypothetical protein